MPLVFVVWGGLAGFGLGLLAVTGGVAGAVVVWGAGGAGAGAAVAGGVAVAGALVAVAGALVAVAGAGAGGAVVC